MLVHQILSQNGKQFLILIFIYVIYIYVFLCSYFDILQYYNISNLGDITGCNKYLLHVGNKMY